MVSKHEVTGTARAMLSELLRSTAYRCVQLVIIGFGAIHYSQTGNAAKFICTLLALAVITVTLVVAAVVLRILYVKQTIAAGGEQRPVPVVGPVAGVGPESIAVVGAEAGAVESTAPVPEAGAADAGCTTPSS